jgi:hypothetical protein
MGTAALVAATLVAPLATREARRRLGSRLDGWEDELVFWARIAYGILPLAVGWLTGSVFARDCGLLGMTSGNWLIGLGACALLLAGFAVGLRLDRVKAAAAAWFHPGEPFVGVLDEPRWAFYRGAAAVAFPGPLAFQTIGLALGCLEWTIVNGRPTRAMPPRVWSGLVRLTVSAVLFAITRNLWLVLLTQAAAEALLRRSVRARPPSP